VFFCSTMSFSILAGIPFCIQFNLLTDYMFDETPFLNSSSWNPMYK
jgi:hypothetical protein